MHLLPDRNPTLFTADCCKITPLVHIFEEMRNILIYDTVNNYQILKAILISFVYFVLGVVVFYLSYDGAKNRGTLINMGE